ncbi:uncharacterized protein LOC129801782 isoform X2 [Phlebotomus papatasi]|nr:uncharacterized protein LOC129801782 isoform X2 [Phlebotomus papatasi]XP_055703080.1 uncharacterized protein LOC129801782 isoform X2 [Phlebotomus papatasi]
MVKDESVASESSNNNYKNDISAVAFFTLVEKKVGQIPEYLKNMLFLNGFAAPMLFENLTIADLSSMENFVKTVMPKICPLTREYFSVFCHNIPEFKIPLGHQNLLLNAVEKVKSDSDSFVKDVLKMKQKTEDRMNNKTFSTKNPIEERRLKGNSQEAEMENKIASKIKILTRQWCEKTDLGNFDKSLIDVDKMSVKLVNVGQNLFAEVLCPICKHHIKIGIWSNKLNKKPRLILSNFNSHIRMHAKRENLKRVSSTTTTETHAESLLEDEGTSEVSPEKRRTRRSSARLEASRPSGSHRESFQAATPKALGQIYNSELLESISDFWLSLEMEFGDGEEIVPRYLQNFLHLMGFGTRKALSLLRDEDFDILERYGKQKMKVWTEKEPESVEFFLGPFARAMDEFEIALGYKRQLMELKESLARQMESNRRQKMCKNGETTKNQGDPIAQEKAGESSHFTQVLLKEYKSEESESFFSYE